MNAPFSPPARPLVGTRKTEGFVAAQNPGATGNGKWLTGKGWLWLFASLEIMCLWAAILSEISPITLATMGREEQPVSRPRLGIWGEQFGDKSLECRSVTRPWWDSLLLHSATRLAGSGEPSAGAIQVILVRHCDTVLPGQHGPVALKE